MRKLARIRLAALLSCLSALPLMAQVTAANSLEARVWRQGNARIVDFPDPPARTEPAATVSVDQLRRPLPAQARTMLLKAQRLAESADHLGAIQQLTETIAKFPESAPWAKPLLGIEYLRTDQFAEAVTILEQAVLLLPRDAMNRSNFGLSLASVGDYTRAKRELRRALELDGSNVTTKQLLELLLGGHPKPAIGGHLKTGQ